MNSFSGVSNGALATAAEVAEAYPSRLRNGKAIPAQAAERRREATKDICAFVAFVETLGFKPDLSNGLELRDAIARWKSARKVEGLEK